MYNSYPRLLLWSFLLLLFNIPLSSAQNGPDITINTTRSVYPTTAGETFEVTYTIGSFGGADVTKPFKITTNIGGQLNALLGEFIIDQDIPRFTTVNITRTFTVAGNFPEGTYDLLSSIKKPNNDNYDENTNNNIAFARINIEAGSNPNVLPDITARNLVLRTESPTSIQYDIEYQNIGEGFNEFAIGYIYVSDDATLSDDDVEVFQVIFPGLNAGLSAERTARFFFNDFNFTGEKYVIFSLNEGDRDGNRIREESNLTNNTISALYDFGGATNPPTDCNGNILTNGGFEDDINNWSVETGQVQPTSDAASGTGAAEMLTTPSQTRVFFLQEISVPNLNTEYELTYAVKAGATGAGRLDARIFFRDADGRNTNNQSNISTIEQNNFVTGTVRAVPTPNAVNMRATFAIDNFFTGGETSAIIDNVCLRPVGEGLTPIDCDAENILVGREVFDAEFIKEGNVSVSSVFPFSQSRIASMRGTGSARIFQDVPAVTGATYTLEAFGRRSGNDAQGRLQLQFINENTGNIADQSVVAINTDYWKNYVVSGTAPAGATTVRVRAVLDSGTSNNSFVEAADFCLTSPDDGGPMRDPDLILSALTSDAGDVLRPGQTVNLTYTVDVVDANAPATTARFTLRGQTLNPFNNVIFAEENIPAIARNGSQTFNLTYTLPADAPIGEYLIIAQVDPDEEITEFSEFNNQANIRFDVDYFDLEIVEITCPTDFPARVPFTQTYPITFRNNSTTATPPLDLNLFQEETGRGGGFYPLLNTQTIPSIPAGQTVTIDYVWDSEGVTFPGFRNNNGEVGRGNIFFSFAPQVATFYGGQFLLNQLDLFCRQTNTDVAVSVTSDNPTFGDDLISTFTVTVTNNGPETAYNIETFLVNDEIPFGTILGTPILSEGLIYQQGGFPSPQIWAVADLAPGESATATLTYRFFRQDTPNTDEEIITVSFTSPSTNDSNEANNTASLTFTPDDGTVVCPLEISNRTMAAPNVAPGETFTITRTFTNQSNQNLAASTIAFYNFIYDENGNLLERRALTSLGNLPAFTPNESKEVTVSFRLNDPVNYESFIFDGIFQRAIFLVANTNAQGRSEASQWWDICNKEEALVFDFPDVDLDLSFVGDERCFGTDNIIQTDVELRNNGNETVPGPFKINLIEPDRVNTSLPNLAVIDVFNGQVVQWTINQDLAPNEAVVLSRPYRNDNPNPMNAGGLSIRAALVELGEELENTGINSIGDFALFDENCGNTSPNCSGDVTLSNQAEVNAFGPCTVFNGNLTIDGNDIASLNNLSTLQQVTGILTIQNTTVINLRGLENLQGVDGLNINNNDNLRSLAALSNLIQSPEVISIINNDQLSSLSGLDNVAGTGTLNVVDNESITTLRELATVAVSSAIIITNNPNLERLEAFSNVQSLTTLLLNGNPKLAEIGFNNLTNVADFLQVIGSNLTNLNGLSALQEVLGGLTLANNPRLADISGLDNVNTVGDLTLTLHPLLSDCCALFSLLDNNGVTGRTDISQNGMSCNSAQDILDNCEDNTGGNIDLKLTLTATNPDLLIYQSSKFTLTITNEGGQTATNVKVDFSNPNVVLKGGEQPDPSQGSFDFFGDQIWNVGTLAAGETATLDVNYFFLTEPFLYAEVSMADGNDADSTPDNGDGQNANEDDEVVFPAGDAPPQLPDLALANLNIPTDGIIQAGDVVDYLVDVQNLGDITANGSYTITAFLSTDSQLDNSDVEVGVIPTGNTPVGTIADVPGAITVPNGTANGDYFLVVQTDSDEEITESNEDNNTVSVSLTIGDGGGCPDVYEPVCGSDGVTYGNACEAEKAGIADYTPGECDTTPPCTFSETGTLRDLTGQLAGCGFVIQLTDGSSLEPLGFPTDFTPVDGQRVRFTSQLALDVASVCQIGPIVDIICMENIPTNDGIDIELTLTAENPDVSKFQSSRFVLTVENKGTATAGNVNVFFNNDNVVLANGDQPVTSQGNFDFFGFQNWNVGDLAGGATATLEVNYFFLAEPFLYAQVTSAGGDDPDSTPNNGNPQSANEDDEVIFPEGTIGDPLPELALGALTIPNEVNAGSTFNYQVEVINGTDVPVVGSYTVEAFLSPDQFLSEQLDIQVDEVILMDTPGSARIPLNRSVTVPVDLPEGNYFLILKVDGELQITEVSESNNLRNGQLQVNPPNSNLPDLALANLNIPTDGIIQAGEVVEYFLDVQNLGTATASGEYTIAAFLSTDNQLDNGDTQVGVIPTGNTPVGTIADVLGAITVPNGTAEGDYFLIVQTDRDDDITESNESNNIINISLTIGDGGVCPTNYDPVCGANGITYDNACLAEKAGVFDYSVGECFSCTQEYDPVCGSDGVTYGNACLAGLAGITDFTLGECTPTGDDIDLELSLNAANPDVLVYQNTVFQLTISNRGDAPATNVQVSLPLVAGQAVLAGGTEVGTSQGSYDPFEDQVWNIGTLGAGQNATLEIDVFFLTKPFLFAEVIAATGNDPDSTPNNGDGQTVNEDDEAIFGGTVGNNNCRIILSIFNKRCDDNGTPDNPEDDTFSFTLRATANNGGSTFGILSPINTFAPVPYGEDLNVSDFPIKDGAVEVIVVDSDNDNCRTELLVQPPATCSNGSGGSSDLVLTIDAPATYRQYTTVPIVYTITNNGDGMAQNVVIQTPQPDGTTNSSSEVTQGEFDLFREQWLVGNLAAGESATLTWNVFAVTGDGIDGFGQIAGSDDKVTFSIGLGNLKTPNTNTFHQPISGVQLYPTITTNRATIAFNSLEDLTLETAIYNLQGQRILTNKTLIHKGLNQIQLDVAQLTAGTYFVKIGQFKTLRLVKM